MRHTSIRMAAGLAATLTAVTLSTTLGATPANAGWDVYASSLDGGASFEFQHYGEHVILTDRKADGRGVHLRYEVGSTRKTLYWGGGANTSKDFNLSFAEGTIIYFSVCTIDNGTVITSSCSDWWAGEA